ncbi:hypothetical protein SAMN03159343_2357 [Klenkia marina]|uniref:Cell division protein FtsL n=1 Tax=Klenkia marina TaxID=1960309 RepID=A0A1G4Y9X0_9ACTN|nr:hypothetical protein [Klenkia marina]SCX50185.1 hypothetical protein SAMN03159343_2357 [Klenkia marina]
MSATARVHTGSLRARGSATARTSTARTSSARTSSARTSSARTSGARTSSPRTSPTRRTGPVHVRPQLRLVTAPVGTPARQRRVAAARPRRAPFVVLLVTLIAATALGLLALNTAIAVDSLRASQQRTANQELARDVERLQQQVTQGRTPAELAAAAAAAGLVPAGTAGHLVLGPDGTSVVRGAPVPAAVPEAAQPALPAAPPAEQPTTQQPTTEQPTTEQPATTDPTTPTAGG